MNREQILAWIGSLTDKQLVELFYDATSDRDVDGEQGRLAVAKACTFPDDERETTFLALPDPDAYPSGWVDDAPFCQSGSCVECECLIRSFAKRVICPICGAKANCT